MLLGLKYKEPLVFTTMVSPVILRASLIDAGFAAPAGRGRAVFVNCSSSVLKPHTKTRECLGAVLMH